MATLSSIPAWRILWAGRPRTMGSQRVGHDRATYHNLSLCETGTDPQPVSAQMDGGRRGGCPRGRCFPSTTWFRLLESHNRLVPPGRGTRACLACSLSPVTTWAEPAPPPPPPAAHTDEQRASLTFSPHTSTRLWGRRGLPILVKPLSRCPDGGRRTGSQASELPEGRWQVRCQSAWGGVDTPGKRVGGTLRFQQVGELGRGLGRRLTPVPSLWCLH